MSNPENKDQGKGFEGLQSLGAKSPEVPAPVERKPERPVLPPAWQDNSSQQTAQPAPIHSQTAASPWRYWVIGLGILGAIVVLSVWVGNQSSSNGPYSPSSETGYSSVASESTQADPAPEPAMRMPPVGNGLVLGSEQIRYCVYEDRRIKGAEKVVNSYNQWSVDTFNAMVEDYNSRCGHYQYRQGALTPIEREADQIQAQLEQEGRERLIDSDAAAADAAQAAADTAALAADAAVASANATGSSNNSGSSEAGNYYSGAAAAAAEAAAAAADVAVAAAEAAEATEAAAASDSTDEASGASDARGYSASVDPKNLETCLSGNYPSLCKRSLLTESQKIQVADAERRENLKTCLSGSYPSLCKRSLLSESEKGRVAEAERRENMRTCISGSYPSLCKRSLLSDAERVQVDQAERRENLRTCLTGNYPSLCKRPLLTESERGQVEEAERRENLRVCLSGNYPSLCKRSLLTDAERTQVARAEAHH